MQLFTPEYAFGFGLSYTSFEYSHLQVSEPDLRQGGRVTVSAEVADTGSREGDEVVQLYVHEDSASVGRPVRELKGFRRVHLKPGERRTVKFDVAPEALAFYDEHEKLVTEPGKIHVWIAPDSVRGVEGSFALQASTRLPPR